MKEKVVCEAKSHKGKDNGRFSHGHCVGGYSNEYYIWSAMVQRCTNSKNKSYKNYGGRGIGVSKEWLIFDNFIVDMGIRPSKNLTLERRDNNKDYTKSNCIWATRTDQARNKRHLKLSLKQVNKIRTLLEEGILTQRKIASQFDVSPTTICEIKKGRTHGWH